MKNNNYEDRYCITAIANDGFKWFYNQVFKTLDEAEAFAEEVRKTKGEAYKVIVDKIQVIC